VQGGKEKYTAPYAATPANNPAVITANGTSCPPISLTVLQPDGIQYYWLQTLEKSVTEHGFSPFVAYETKYYAAIFITPGDVSFKNIVISELDTMRPHSNAVSDKLSTIHGTNAWFVGGCDDNHQPAISPSHSLNVSFPVVFKKTNGSNETPFAMVRTTGLLLSDNITLQKGQINAGGGYVDPIGSGLAEVIIPIASAGPVLPDISGGECLKAVQDQFTLF
jgi:hypothetical protein